MLRGISELSERPDTGAKVQLMVFFPVREVYVVRMPVFLWTGAGLGMEKSNAVRHAWNCGNSRMVQSHSLPSTAVIYNVGPLLAVWSLERTFMPWKWPEGNSSLHHCIFPCLQTLL